MSEQEFDSSVSSVEDNVEADRNQEARGAAEQFSDDDGSRREGEEEQSETPAKAEHQAGAYKDSDEDNDSDGETIKAVTAAANKAATSYFSSDSEHGSPRERKHSAEPVVGTQEPAQDKADTSMADVFGESDEDDNNDATSGKGSGDRKRRRLSEDEDQPSSKRKTNHDSASEGEGEEEGSVVEHDQETSELHNVEDEEVEEAGEEAGGSTGAQPTAEKDEDDDEPEDGPGTSSGVSDFDLMMQKRKEAMSRARRRHKKDVYITANDDHIAAMLRQMKQAAEEDRKLNLERKAATKKLQLLPVVTSHLKKAELLSSFIECGILSALADWLTPLPDHSLPNLKIRESILDVLGTFPPLDSSLLKSSRLGKAVMLIYRHPKETRKNREKAGKLINDAGVGRDDTIDCGDDTGDGGDDTGGGGGDDMGGGGDDTGGGGDDTGGGGDDTGGGGDDTGDGEDDTGDGEDDTGDGEDDTGDGEDEAGGGGEDDTGDGGDDTGDAEDDTGDGGDDTDESDAGEDGTDVCTQLSGLLASVSESPIIKRKMDSRRYSEEKIKSIDGTIWKRLRLEPSKVEVEFNEMIDSLKLKYKKCADNVRIWATYHMVLQSKQLVATQVSVHCFIKKLLRFLNNSMDVTKVLYFSDGASAQYKNKKNFVFHIKDFNMEAEWHFFATAHGKGGCDGIVIIILGDWARPIFGLASDFKILSRDEREERDFAHLQAAKRRKSSDSQKQQEDEVTEEPQKPGDKGWIGRARVPRPSNKDYVVRPKWNVETEFKKSSSSSKMKNRYEQHVQKFKQKKQGANSTHAVSISIEGRKMPL
ncbi:hypothetical protein EMCRGX_G025942 [Ephydatia muelleri]